MQLTIGVGALLVLALALALALTIVVRRSNRAVEHEPPFFGLDVPAADVHEVTRISSALGCGPGVVNRFVKLNSDLTPEQVRSLGGGGRLPMLSLEPWLWQMGRRDSENRAYSLDSLVRGEHDADLRRLARVLASYGGPVLLRFAHEMNADWYPWAVAANGNSVGGYVRAWRHVHDLVAAIAPRVEWVWSPVASWWPDALPLRSVYPGDDYVDFVAASGYGHGGTAEQTFGSWYAEVRVFTRRPALLSEIGADGPDKADWIASLVPFLERRPGIRGFVWFNTSPETTGATGDYRIDNEPQHLQAMQRALDSLHVRCVQNPSPGATS